MSTACDQIALRGTDERGASDDPVAVVGLGCRFPGGAGVEDFWDLLVSGGSGVVEVPGDRWDVDAFFSADPDVPGRMVSRRGGFVGGVREFDAGLFGVPPREAVGVDPQHRLVLEVAWEALECAGVAPDSLRGSRTGVFIGMGGSDYERLNLAPIDAYSATGVAQNFAANRLSYVLGLEGPSMVVDTACSSSLVAVHLARQAILAGECDIAIAGGVNLMLSPDPTIALSQGRMLSPDGECRTFDADANGYVRGEGCGVVVLRRWSAARAGGQRAWALLRGSATNQDGRSNGLTAPRGAAQEDVIRRALLAADVAPAEVGYVETHGTGTALGDPIEVRALASVLSDGRTPDRPVRLGAVKANIGHLEAAAGIAGLIKAVLVVDRGVVPPNVHVRQLSPFIPWERLPVDVPVEPVEWSAQRRVAGVSSFGFGGTNAHVIVESAPEVSDAPSTESTVLVKVTGRGGDAVRDGAARLAAWLSEHPDAGLGAVAWAAGTGRAELADRAAIVAGSVDELAAGLAAVAGGRPAPGVVTGRRGGGGRPRIGFVVPGQGPRLAGALAGVYGQVPVVTDVIDTIAAVVGPVSGLPLSVLLDDSEDSARALEDTAVSQPALFAVAVALGRWWQSAGVRPDVVLGHSAGAYVAAVLAGVWSLEDGIRLVRARTTLMAELPSDGVMAAVFCGPDQLAGIDAISSGDVVIASYNGPREQVISGPTGLVLDVMAQLAERQIKSVRLRVSYGSHSPLMEPVLAPLAAAFDGVELHLPEIECVSDRTGEPAGPDIATVDYWVRHTREPVRFVDAMRTMLDGGVTVVIELGPGGLLPLFLSVAGERELVCAPSIVTETGVRQGLLESAARVWVAGVPLDWTMVNGERPGRPPVLPTYPFQRRTYWPDGTGNPEPSRPAASPEPLPEQLPAVAIRVSDRSQTERVDALVSYLRTELTQVLALDDEGDLDADTGLFDLGLTSAMVVGLRSTVQRDLGSRISATSVFEHPTIRRLATYLAAVGGDVPVVATEATAPARTDEPIAIVGMACRFPGGASDLAGYWRLLHEGRDGTSDAPAGRWAGAGQQRFHGGYLDGPVDEFDADAFGITPREARHMDPQQRLLLEVTWEALENAGIDVATVEDSPTSVYVGITTADYLHLLAADGIADADAYVATGNTASVAAGRLSYFLGARGPSMAIDTACSSSLVATHLAIGSLRSGEADMAIAAGVNLMLSPTTTQSLVRLGALAPDGRCKTFDASADGYARGEGAGVVVLKRLSDAVAAGDRIWAVLRGSAVNQDGRSAGLTVPNGQAQQDVIRAALRDAGVDAAAVSYVEAHGTGTALGDPIEIKALTAALRSGRDSATPLYVGSVKTNLGHLEAAAGVSSLIKVALSLHHGEIPAHLHFRQPSPFVDWADLPVRVPVEATGWSSPERRIAGVSSFGFSGTNAHVVVEQAPVVTERDSADDEPRAELLVLSARTQDALRATAHAYRALFDGDPVPRLADVTRTAATHRTHLPVRMAVPATSTDEAAERLAAVLRGEQPAEVSAGTVVPGDRRRVVFVYSGQGSQWAGMGTALLAEPVSARVLRRCDDIVREVAGWSLVDELCADLAVSRLADTEIAQPAVFAVQAALTQLWASWGVRPDAVLGHSVGEIAAVYAAGSLDLDDALRVALRRGQVMASTKGAGAMAAIGATPEAVAELIAPYGDRLSIAAVNGPASVVVAGDRAAITELEPIVRGTRTPWARIQDEYAFHTPSMGAVRADLIDALPDLTPRAPGTPVYSTVTGARAADGSFGVDYWADNMIAPVRFMDALRAATTPGTHTVVVEIGPHGSLISPAAQSLGERTTTVASMRSRRDARATMLRAAGALYVLGVDVDLAAVHGDRGRRIDLPGYPWQRTRHWLPGQAAAADPLAGQTYEIDWRPASPSTVDSGIPVGRWLVIGDGPVGQGLATRLRDAGADCVVVPVDAVSDTVLAGANVVHCATLDTDPSVRLPGASLDAALLASCGPLLAAVREAAGRIWVVTRGGVGVPGSGVVPAHAPVWGLGRTVALEHPELWGGLIDLDPDTGDPAADADRVLGEVRGTDGEDQVAYRAGQRRIARLRPAAPVPDASPAISPDATYLITGGRGALGLRVARWLADRGARHLLLTGRGPLPGDPSDPVRAAVERLSADGVTVHNVSVDVTDLDAMSRMLAGDRDSGAVPWPPIRGVVHAAGVFQATAMRDMDWPALRDVLAPKVAGSLVLDALTGELDFFVLFSSASSVWGSALAGHYAAANHFEDVIAHDRVTRGLPGLAVDWGWWSGSDLVAPQHLRYFEAMGLHMLPDDVGFAALGRLMAAGATQMTVAPVDWSRFRPVLEAKRRRPMLELLGEPATSDGPATSTVDERLLNRLRTAPDTTRRRLLEERLQREVAAVLGRADDTPLDRELGFFEVGMDSIMSVELKNRVEAILGVQLAATVAFEHPTVAALAEHIITDALRLPAGPSSREDETGPDAESRLAELSEEELLKLLGAELEREQP